MVMFPCSLKPLGGPPFKMLGMHREDSKTSMCILKLDILPELVIAVLHVVEMYI